MLMKSKVMSPSKIGTTKKENNPVNEDLNSNSKVIAKLKAEENNTKIVLQEFAVYFFSSLLGRYHKLKNHCKINNIEECKIFDSDDAILAKAIKSTIDNYMFI